MDGRLALDTKIAKLFLLLLLPLEGKTHHLLLPFHCLQEAEDYLCRFPTLTHMDNSLPLMLIASTGRNCGTYNSTSLCMNACFTLSISYIHESSQDLKKETCLLFFIQIEILLQLPSFVRLHKFFTTQKATNQMDTLTQWSRRVQIYSTHLLARSLTSLNSCWRRIMLFCLKTILVINGFVFHVSS